MCIRWRTKAGNCMTNSSKEQVTQAFFFFPFFLVTKLNTYTMSKSGEHTTCMVMLRLLGRDRAKQPPC